MKIIVKNIFVTIFLLLFCENFAFAATPSYGPFPYSKSQTYNFYGDLSPSGVGINQARDAYLLWHDVRYHNVITGEYKPASGYIPTVQFDLIEQSGDNMGNKRGYHVINVEENKAAIKHIVQDAGGNFDFVSRMLDAGKHPFLKNKFYMVDGKYPYVSFGAIISLSGGGNPTVDNSNLGHGVDLPVFQTTYQVTPWPVIRSAALSDSSLSIDVQTYSVYDNAATVWIVQGAHSKDEILSNMSILSGPTAKKLVDGQTGGVVKGNLPNASWKSLLDGQTEMTVVISDPYERIAAKTIPVNVIQPQPTPAAATPKIILSPPNATGDLYYFLNDTRSRSLSAQYHQPYTASYEVNHVLVYNPDINLMLDSTVQVVHHGLHTVWKDEGQNTYNWLSERWKWQVEYEGGATFKLTNISDTSAPLHVIASQIGTGPTTQTNMVEGQSYTLNKGQSVNIDTSFYQLHFPTPAELSGWWQTNHTEWGPHWASDTYPDGDAYQEGIQALLNQK